MFCLGIDTSCYTTSLAAVDESLELAFEGRTILKVPEGSRGLRQSDAFFQHVGNMAQLLEQCMKNIDPLGIKGIAVSTRPRAKEGSYMPVFTAGFNIARNISSVLKLPVYEVSHQDSHIEAGVWSSKHSMKREYFAYHISGGTTELLHVDNFDTMLVTEIGGSSDLSAGQFIDRIGVALGMGFPCGQEMDRLCSEYEIKGIEIPISIKDSHMSFSGPETHVQRIVNGRKLLPVEKAEICAGIFRCIAEAIQETVINAKVKYTVSELLLVGGVASNKWIRRYLADSVMLRNNGIEVVFSDERYSPDNASGTAVLGMKRLLNGQ